MAALDLTIHPSLMIAQGGIFLLAIFLIHRLFFLPYLSLQEKREQLTNASSGAALDLKKELEEKRHHIEHSFSKAQGLIKTKREEQKKRHETMRKDFYERMGKESESFLKDKKQELRESLQQAALTADQAVGESTKAVLKELGWF